MACAENINMNTMLMAEEICFIKAFFSQHKGKDFFIAFSCPMEWAGV
jgi:hypothetical protein